MAISTHEQTIKHCKALLKATPESSKAHVIKIVSKTVICFKYGSSLFIAQKWKTTLEFVVHINTNCYNNYKTIHNYNT